MKALARRWIDAPAPPIPAEIDTLAGGQELVARRLVQQGMRTAAQARAFLDPDAYQPASALDLPDLEPTVDRLEQAVRRGEALCVWGDFDVDGQTSTTLLVSTLAGLGGRVSSHIPVRARESHGVNIPELQRILDGGVKLILTCDTGVAAVEAAAFARERGAELWVTDHHDLPPELPPANGVVDPKRLPEGHALRSLPGVGTAYLVAAELAKRFGREDLAQNNLDLVALGIVADVAEQTADTRYLLQRGLRQLRRSDRLGLLAMCETTGLNPERISEEHIGFMIGPRLNALGRLGDANPIVEFFTTRDAVRARTIAAELEGLNAQRRLLCEQVFQAAQAQLEHEPSLLNEAALVLAHPTWPAGIIGIVASRLVDLYHRPVILIYSPPGETARGSARSVPGFNVTAAIRAGAEHLLSFGGHPMAAGIGLDADQIPAFRRAFLRVAAEQLGPVPVLPELTIDAWLDLGQMNLDLVAQIERLAPFGAGNPPFSFAAANLSLAGKSRIGKNGEHLQLTVQDAAGQTARVIWWQGGAGELPEGRFDLAFSLRASDYRGAPEVQIEWIDARPAAGEAITLPEAAPARELLDFRRQSQPLQALRPWLADPQTAVWVEGSPQPGLAGHTRLEVAACETLVIWTAPVGQAELEAVLASANPRRVIWVAEDPGLDTVEPFLNRLMGLVKYALRNSGAPGGLARLAAATAQRERTVLVGLQWMQAKGWVKVVIGGDTLRLAAGTRVEDGSAADALQAQVRALLQETAAYRAFLRMAPLEDL